jgi:signal transduction histidine kinase
VVQIIGNLLSNAIKFTLPGGRIEMRCEAREDTVLLRVTDTGIGIPHDQLAAIFEPFVQVRSGLAGRDSGVGLGLAISRDLARAMGGDLTVVSEPGVGSTFTLSLPAAAPKGSSGSSTT